MLFHSQLTVFCEGTRFTKKKHDVSVEYAKSKSLQPLKHHLMPRTRGFTMLANGMRKFGKSLFLFYHCSKTIERQR